MAGKVEEQLRKAFVELMKTDDEKISVSALCKKGNISRASFYVHYDSIEEFVEKNREYTVNRIFDQMLSTIDAAGCIDRKYKSYKMILTDTDIGLLSIYIGKHSYQHFAYTANKLIYPKFRKLMIEHWGEEYFTENESTFEFALNGSVAMLCIDLLSYDKETFTKNAHRITAIMKDLFPIEERFGK